MRLASSDLEDTREWPAQPGWASSVASVDLFALHYHNIAKLRTKYPFVTIYAAQLPSSRDAHMQLPSDVFQRYPNVQVQTRVGLMQDGNFHLYEDTQIEVFLFDIGPDSFFDFGGMVDELSRFHGAIFLSKRAQDLTVLKRIVEQTRAEKLREELLAHYDILFIPNSEGDFLLATEDSAVVEAFLQSPRLRK